MNRTDQHKAPIHMACTRRWWMMCMLHGTMLMLVLSGSTVTQLLRSFVSRG
ncbi:MAG: hypothetical protein ABW184_13885 [Sphingobium sp.]